MSRPARRPLSLGGALRLRILSSRNLHTRNPTNGPIEYCTPPNGEARTRARLVRGHSPQAFPSEFRTEPEIRRRLGGSHVPPPGTPRPPRLSTNATPHRLDKNKVTLRYADEPATLHATRGQRSKWTCHDDVRDEKRARTSGSQSMLRVSAQCASRPRADRGRAASTGATLSLCLLASLQGVQVKLARRAVSGLQALVELLLGWVPRPDRPTPTLRPRTASGPETDTHTHTYMDPTTWIPERASPRLRGRTASGSDEWPHDSDLQCASHRGYRLP